MLIISYFNFEIIIFLGRVFVDSYSFMDFRVGWHSEPKLEFNLHPMAMSFGFVFLNGEAITVYRGARNSPKKNTKLIHMVFQLAAVVLSILGIIVRFLRMITFTI